MAQTSFQPFTTTIKTRSIPNYSLSTTIENVDFTVLNLKQWIAIYHMKRPLINHQTLTCGEITLSDDQTLYSLLQKQNALKNVNNEASLSPDLTLCIELSLEGNEDEINKLNPTFDTVGSDNHQNANMSHVSSRTSMNEGPKSTVTEHPSLQNQYSRSQSSLFHPYFQHDPHHYNYHSYFPQFYYPLIPNGNINNNNNNVDPNKSLSNISTISSNSIGGDINAQFAESTPNLLYPNHNYVSSQYYHPLYYNNSQFMPNYFPQYNAEVPSFPMHYEMAYNMYHPNVLMQHQDPTQPVQPVQSMQPIQPIPPIQPIQPTQPVQPIQNIQNGQQQNPVPQNAQNVGNNENVQNNPNQPPILPLHILGIPFNIWSILNINMIIRLSIFLVLFGQHLNTIQFTLLSIILGLYYLHNVGLFNFIIRRRNNEIIHRQNENAAVPNTPLTYFQLFKRFVIGLTFSLYPEWDYGSFYPVPLQRDNNNVNNNNNGNNVQ